MDGLTFTTLSLKGDLMSKIRHKHFLKRSFLKSLNLDGLQYLQFSSQGCCMLCLTLNQSTLLER